MAILRLWSVARTQLLLLSQTDGMNKSTLNSISAAMLCLVACVLLQNQALSANAQGLQAPKLPPIERILPYTDEDYDFQIAVPEHWSVNFMATHDEQTDALEPGYAVGFESPRSDAGDVFADYLMVEILPGAHSGAFETDGSQTKVIMVDGRAAITDRVNLDNFEIDGNQIDLVVFQAEIVELGFTVCIFAIGEQREADVLRDAFQLALKTFKVPDDPFSVS